MKVRELLQTEIWSKRTTRNILFLFGVVVGVIVVGSVVMYEIERHWLTTGERNAAIAAIAQIDGLQDFSSLSDEEFDAREKQAEAKVEAAKHAAVTKRDEWLSFNLDVCLNETKSDRDEVRIALLFWEKHLPVGSSKTEFGKKLDLSGTELRTLSRMELHKELD